MHYQVIARAFTPAGPWEHYPYWAPVRDKEAAMRLATYAAQTGHEAAILQSVTAEMLRHIAQAVVERQDTQLLPALRFLPGARVATTAHGPAHQVETAFHPAVGFDHYTESFDKAELDRCRVALELGPGGDLTQRADWREAAPRFPLRMDTLQRWVELRRLLLSGAVGGADDGATPLAAEGAEG